MLVRLEGKGNPYLYCRERKLEAFLIHRGNQQVQDSTNTKGVWGSHVETYYCEAF